MGFFTQVCDICGEKGMNRCRVAKSCTKEHTAWICSKCLKKASEACGITVNVWTVTIEELKEMVAEREDTSEHRKKCNVCGNVFCYTSDDMARNLHHLNQASAGKLLSGLNALGGTAYHMYEQDKRAESSLNKIIDYTKCPNCGSTDLREITEEELKAEQAKSNNNGGAAISSADELKKYKDLLDSGVITQEEFDAKKKQLLGL